VLKRWQKAAIWAAVAGLSLAAILIFLPVDSVFAAVNDSLGEVGAASGLPTTSLPILIARIIRAILGVLGILTVLLVLYAGFLYLTSRGEEEPIKKAKKILQNAVIGLLIIFSSFAITTFVLNALLSAAGMGGGVSTAGTNYSEPLSGSLGAGIIESHYPARNALDIPRNTRISVTFKEVIDVNSIVSDYAAAVEVGSTTFALNTENVLIYPTNEVNEDTGVTAADVALGSTEVVVSFTEDLQTFVFAPIDYLGSSTEDTSYTVFLGSGIQKINNDGEAVAAFTGTEDGGYEWTFEVSTEVDLTPPTVVSIIPVDESTEAPNVVVQITFSEAMDPVAASGTYGDGKTFTNFSVLSEGTGENIDGASSISNQYRTVEFVPTFECAKDPCGNTIYCLPYGENINVEARAATVNGDEAPQAVSVSGLFDGLADAAGNSLDGDGDWGTTDGEAGDDYAWNFVTTSEVNDEVPVISELFPSLEDNDKFGVDDEVEITFDIAMRSATLNTSNIRLESDYNSADPSEAYQNVWFSLSSETLEGGNSKTTIDHGTLWESVENEDGSTTLYYYYPVITNDVQSAYQICMFPSFGPENELNTSPDCATETEPYCCNGSSSGSPCYTQESTKILGQ
jgi:hypothetical protein